MNFIQTALLVLHIAGGAAALIAGTGAILYKKGSKRHRLMGVIVYWGMMAVAASAVALSIIKNIPFLLAIAFFSFYMTYTGRRSIQNKKLIPSKLDWVVAVIMMPPVVYMLLSGNIVLTVFGFVLMGYVVPDLLHFFKKIDLSKKWLIRHISRMMGSYIATVTAFLVVNVTFDPWWVIWLLPTVVLSPVIALYIRKYSPKTRAASVEV